MRHLCGQRRPREALEKWRAIGARSSHGWRLSGALAASFWNGSFFLERINSLEGLTPFESWPLDAGCQMPPTNRRSSCEDDLLFLLFFPRRKEQLRRGATAEPPQVAACGQVAAFLHVWPTGTERSAREVSRPIVSRVALERRASGVCSERI